MTMIHSSNVLWLTILEWWQKGKVLNLIIYAAKKIKPFLTKSLFMRNNIYAPAALYFTHVLSQCHLKARQMRMNAPVFYITPVMK